MSKSAVICPAPQDGRWQTAEQSRGWLGIWNIQLQGLSNQYQRRLPGWLA
jgi:hypothetical protein